MPTMTPTTGAVFIPEVWAKDIQMARRNKLVMGPLVDHRYESDLMAYGDTVHITSVAEMNADQITPGTPLTPVAPTEVEQTLVVDQYYGKAIQLQDMLKRQSKYDLRKPYADVIGFALAAAIDGSLLAQFANVATANKRPAVDNIDFDEIVEAHGQLDKANVPQEDRFLVVNWAGLEDLRKEDEFRRFDATGKANVVGSKLGIVGEIYNTPVYLTNAVKVNTDSAQDNYQFLLFHKSAFAIVVQQDVEMESDRDILLKADILSGSCLWGVKTVRNDHAVVIRRKVPTP